MQASDLGNFLEPFIQRKENLLSKETFAFRSITRQPPKRPLSKVTRGKSRKFSSTYRSKDEYGTEQVECKSFFLATLGFHPKNDSLITTIFMDLGFDAMYPKPDQRGNNLAHKRLDHKQICDYIESFNPGISHYRREHAPQRRYLPSEITIKAMHGDFLEKYLDSHCSYNLYREVAKLNISFAVLEVEECETCLSHKMADHDHPQNQFCDKCNSWNEHVKKAKIARESYKADSEFDWPSHVSVKSVDLQKVIMLPRISGLKTIAFTKRIIAFHETFATVGTKPT